MGSDTSGPEQLPIGPAALVGTLASFMVLLELAPEELSTFSGRFPALVQGNIPEALALLVCSILIISALVLVILKDIRGIRYLMAGTMLSVFVGSVIMLAGASWTIVRALNGGPVTAEMFLGSGTLSGALLAMIALAALRRAFRRIDTKMPGGGT